MKCLRIYLFFLVSALLCGNIQAQSQLSLTELMSQRNEYYFSLNVQEPTEIQDINTLCSVDATNGSTVICYANQTQYDNLLAAGYQPHLLTPPSLREEAMMYDPQRSTYDWDSYLTYPQYVSMMEGFPATAVSGRTCTLLDLGTLSTSNHRRILGVRINNGQPNGKPKFLYTSTMHGDEVTGMILMLRLIDEFCTSTDSRIVNLLNNLDIFIFPCTNPDGTYYGGNNTVNGARRYNGNGIDLNRHFPDFDDGAHPDGASYYQDEAQWMMDLAQQYLFTMGANYHGGAEVVNYPWDTYQPTHPDDAWWRLVSREYANLAQSVSSNYMTDENNGITNGYAWYTITGSRQDYMNYYGQCRELTLECSSSKTPSASQLPNFWNYNHNSMLTYMEQCLYGVHGVVRDANTQQPIEGVTVKVQNHDALGSWVTTHTVGDFHRPIKGGTYTFVFEKEGYCPKFVDVTVADGQTVNLEVEMTTGSCLSPAFTASSTIISLGQSISFTDNSYGDIVSWQWTFEGATPSSSTQQNPTGITYNESGTYDVTLTITDADGNSETLTKTDYIQVEEAYYMQNGTFETCSALFYDSGGSSSNYSNNEDYTMTFTPSSPGAKITVNFLSFDVENAGGWWGSTLRDYLSIYDGTSSSATLIGQYYGTDLPGTITATNSNGALTFVFHSNNSTTKAGWKANISCTYTDYVISATANPTNGGTVTGAGNYSYGESITLQATPNAGYTFDNWTENGNEVSSNASYTFTVTGNRNLVANFSLIPLPTYTVTVSANPAEGGSVTGGGTFEQGQSCTVTATANDNYVFNNWTEDGVVVSSSASYTFIVNESHALVANFTYVPPTYTVSVSANPANGGNVTGGGNYLEGVSCTVNATPNTNYTFTNWTENGAVVSTDANYTFTVNENRTLVANFTYVPQTYTVSVSANPTNGGSVSGGGNYTEGQSCTITATPNTNYTFSNWTENGIVVSSSANYTFIVNENHILVANFTYVPPTYTISVTANPTNGGTVTGGGNYLEGVSCTVNATPNTHYSFTNWTENGAVVSTNASYTFTVNENRTLVANFTYVQPTYTISVTANPTNGGTVTGGGNYLEGVSCTVSATPNTNYTFTNWTENGAVVSTNANYTFTVNENRTLVANFTYIPPTYTISVTANPTNGGNVSGGGTYIQGQSCTVMATPSNGYSFVNWTENGSFVSSSASYTFTVNANRNLVANFTLNSYTISLSANPSNGGIVTGGGTFTYGQNCTITAIANNGFTFINWTENGSFVSSSISYTFAVYANRNLVANFTANPQPTYTISVSANPTDGGTIVGGGTYQEGQNCTVRATPATGYTFLRWTENGVGVSTNANYTFTVTGNRNLVANFSAMTYIITASVDPTDGGTVFGAGSYEYGSQASMKIIPNENYIFQNWTENGIIVSEEQEYSFTVTSNRDLVAHLMFIDGVGEHANVEIDLYPNPVKNLLTVEAQEDIDQLEVFNLIGALVYNKKNCTNKVEIATSDLAPGTYIIRLTTQNALEIRKFVKE